MSTPFEIVTDYICPWCYLSTTRVERLAAFYDLELRYTFFPLHPNPPAGGVPLSEYFRGRGLDIEAMHRQMKARMDAEGLPYHPADRIIDSRLAQELGRWAESKGNHAIHALLYRAHHAEGVDISQVDALVGIAEKAGLDPKEAREVLVERRMKAAVDEDWSKSTAAGVTGVPTFISAGRAVVGAQPYAMLEKLVTLAGAAPRPSA